MEIPSQSSRKPDSEVVTTFPSSSTQKSVTSERSTRPNFPMSPCTQTQWGVRRGEVDDCTREGQYTPRPLRCTVHPPRCTYLKLEAREGCCHAPKTNVASARRQYTTVVVNGEAGVEDLQDREECIANEIRTTLSHAVDVGYSPKQPHLLSKCFRS